VLVLPVRCVACPTVMADGCCSSMAGYKLLLLIVVDRGVCASGAGTVVDERAVCSDGVCQLPPLRMMRS